MINGDDDGLPIADPSYPVIDVIGGFYDELHDDEPATIDDWKARDVENSPVAWMNQFLNGGPLEDFDRFVLTANLDPASKDGDPYAADHRSIDFSPVVWSLLLKEARNLPSDEKLEFYLKGREDVGEFRQEPWLFPDPFAQADEFPEGLERLLNFLGEWPVHQVVETPEGRPRRVGQPRQHPHAADRARQERDRCGELVEAVQPQFGEEREGWPRAERGQGIKTL